MVGIVNLKILFNPWAHFIFLDVMSTDLDLDLDLVILRVLPLCPCLRKLSQIVERLQIPRSLLRCSVAAQCNLLHFKFKPLHFKLPVHLLEEPKTCKKGRWQYPEYNIINSSPLFLLSKLRYAFSAQKYLYNWQHLHFLIIVACLKNKQNASHFESALHHCSYNLEKVLMVLWFSWKSLNSVKVLEKSLKFTTSFMPQYFLWN